MLQVGFVPPVCPLHTMFYPPVLRALLKPHLSPFFASSLSLLTPGNRIDLLQGCGYLCEKEGDGREGKGPPIFVIEERLRVLGPVEHLVINAGYVEDQPHHQ